jgi:4-amino-4-deoxy-L-arabinose transferase-like glycosyltransferase
MENNKMLDTDKEQSLFTRHPWIVVIGIIILSAAIKLVLITTDRMPFNADEAVVGLMASHILRGEVPIFFWGQSYMGSLDALLVAAVFLLFGKSIAAIRIIQILLFSATIGTTYLLGYRVSRNVEAGWMAALLMAIPSVNVTLYTTISLGGYGEALILGNLILLAGFSTLSKNTWPVWIILGFLSGFGLWVNGLTLVYSIPVVFISLILLKGVAGANLKDKRWKAIALLIAGGLLGAFPWLIYGFQNGYGRLVSELLGSAITSHEVGYFVSLGNRVVSLLLFGITVIFGFRPPWEIRWLALPLIPLITIIWTLIIIGCHKLFNGKDLEAKRVLFLWGVILILIVGFIFTSFGNDPSGRYFLPLAVPLAILAGNYLSSLVGKLGGWRWVILAVLIVYNLTGTFKCWLNYPPGFTTQFNASTVYDQRQQDDLIEFLSENSLDRGYATYWIAYPLAFLSNESLIFVPRLPYHSNFSYTQRDSRYAAYETSVRQAKQISYITAKQPWLDEYLRTHFSAINITWEEKQIGDYRIFYRLSRTVMPEEIGIVSKE